MSILDFFKKKKKPKKEYVIEISPQVQEWLDNASPEEKAMFEQAIAEIKNDPEGASQAISDEELKRLREEGIIGDDDDANNVRGKDLKL